MFETPVNRLRLASPLTSAGLPDSRITRMGQVGTPFRPGAGVRSAARKKKG
jgi:hypothetical protein